MASVSWKCCPTAAPCERQSIIKTKKNTTHWVVFFFVGGPNRDRTDDLTDANRTLSQLSYRPVSKKYYITLDKIVKNFICS